MPAGVIEQAINTAVALHRAANQMLDVIRFGDIAGFKATCAHALSCQFRRNPLPLISAARADDHNGSRINKHPRTPLTDASGSSRYDHPLVLLLKEHTTYRGD